MLKHKVSGAVNQIVTGLRIIISAVTPEPDPGSPVTYTGICSGIEEPKRHINPFNLLDMILIFEYFRQQAPSGEVTHQAGLCRSLIQFERNYDIRLQRTGKLSHQNDRIPAERAGCGCHILIAHDLTAAGFAYVST